MFYFILHVNTRIYYQMDQTNVPSEIKHKNKIKLNKKQNNHCFINDWKSTKLKKQMLMYKLFSLRNF